MPSEILFIDDAYTAFCLNQACAYIRIKIEQEEEMPVFERKFSSFTEMYKDYD
jgi:hypothetical protein|nr:MAG TPA: hypothetical protein [Caudoviricetes sp.]